MHTLERILTTVGSVITICFGVWHFFVPKIWNWYSHIAPEATELVAAVRAINVFFSLCLVVFGVVNILFINGNKANKYAIVTILSATSILWLTRTIMQLVYPQGSMNPAIQYGMLAVFVLVTLCFLIPLCIVITE
ncbi:MAG: hypothetical protein A2231_06345 [Candidatus Firestonebacteria bacterium RIFOXYA2_FULL_40_8]|nr:MAG: hypothetical protein A2231_06345 [Candidatus Firestonebacteria bacterium RIFOXYA2_FULL_40_8]